MKRILLSVPKLGGFRSLYIHPTAVTLSDLAAAFPNGGAITIEKLKAQNLVPGIATRVKVIGNGSLKKPYQLKSITASAGAKAAIEATGGSVM